MGRSRILSEEDIEEIKRMLHKGCYKVDIAKKFCISKQTLFNYLRRENIGIKKRIEYSDKDSMVKSKPLYECKLV